MQAIILAGGFGTRLRPLTYTRAKALLPIMNKPMISYIVEMLPKEIDKVIIAVNYRKDQIEQYFKHYDCGRKIIVNDEPVPLGTGGATKFAEKHINDRFFVLNADTLCSLSLDKMIEFHKKNKAVATISLWPVKNVSEFGVVDIKKNGNVVRFVEKPKPEVAPSNLINAGAYLLEPAVLDFISTGRLVSMEKEIFPQIIQKTGKFYGYQFKGFWIDVGRIRSYLDIHHLLLEKNNMPYLVGSECKIQGTLKNTCVGSHVTVGKNSLVDSSVIFDNAQIGDNVLIQNCVIGEHCKIADSVHLINSVVGDRETVKENTNLENSMVWTQSIPPGYPQKQIGNVIGE